MDLGLVDPLHSQVLTEESRLGTAAERPLPPLGVVGHVAAERAVGTTVMAQILLLVTE